MRGRLALYAASTRTWMYRCRQPSSAQVRGDLVQVYGCKDTIRQAQLRCEVSIHRCTDVQMLSAKLSSGVGCACTDVQIPSAKLRSCGCEVGMYRCTEVQVPLAKLRSSGCQVCMYRCTDVQVPSAKLRSCGYEVCPCIRVTPLSP